METALKGAEKLINTVGFRVQLLLFGVLLPGLITTLELGALLALDDGHKEIWTYLTDQATFKFGSLPAVGTILFLLCTAYIVGYVLRDLTFSLSNTWLRHGWRPARSGRQIMAQLRIVHGAAKVDRVAAEHPVFDLITREAEPAVQSLPRPADFYLREYCKLWLRTRTPQLATDGMEAEINLIVGFVIPVLLGVIPSIAFIRPQFGLAATGVACAVCVVIGLRLLYNINAVRCQETEEAIGNFLFAHWTGLPLAETPAAPRAPRARPSARPAAEPADDDATDDDPDADDPDADGPDSDDAAEDAPPGKVG